MNKRKLFTLALSLCMIAILAVGGTLAYFTSEDAEDNVFTMGNVDITLEEEFEQESNLQPGVEISKDVSIKNTGTNPAYVRAHIAIPANLDAQDPTKTGENVMEYLHFIYGTDDNWNWENGNGEDNFYTATLKNESNEDELYNVYVVTYEKALASGVETGLVIDGVYLDTDVDAKNILNANEEVIGYTYIDENSHEVDMLLEEGKDIVKLSIKVYAEGAQTATFDDAFEALDTAFGVPTSAGYVAPWNK